MTTIIRATEPVELLGLVPALAGCTPRESLVLLPFHDHRTHGVMRVDLPAPEHDPEAVAASMLALLRQVEGVDAVAVVVYTSSAAQATGGGIALPQQTLVDHLLAQSARHRLGVAEALCVTDDGWADYLADEPELHPLRTIPASPAVPGVGDVSGDQLTGAALPPSDLITREQVGRALGQLTEVLARHSTGHGAIREGDDPLALIVADTMLEDLPGFAEELLERPTDDDPYTCAALLWCLNRPVLRDAILVQWATDLDFGERALDAQLRFSDSGAGVPDEVGRVFLGHGPRPDADRLGCALAVARAAASRAPRPAKVGALVAAAWLAWALGRSSHAGAYVDEALSIDPQHSMASLISTMLSAARLPAWSMRRP